MLYISGKEWDHTHSLSGMITVHVVIYAASHGGQRQVQDWLLFGLALPRKRSLGCTVCAVDVIVTRACDRPKKAPAGAHDDTL